MTCALCMQHFSFQEVTRETTNNYHDDFLSSTSTLPAIRGHFRPGAHYQEEARQNIRSST
nr:MAG TPA: hypothetical protein [Caudoviricetes sp.]